MSRGTARFALRPTRVAHPERVLGGLLLGIGLGVGLGWMDLRDRAPPGFAAPARLAAGSFLLLAAAVWAIGVLRRGHPHLLVEVDADELRAPLRRGAQRVVHCSLARIRDVALRGRFFRRLVVTPEKGPLLVVPGRALSNPHGLERLLVELRDRIAALPGGEARLHRHAEIAAPRGFPWTTLAIAIAVLSGFGIELATGALGSPEIMVALGAAHTHVVWQGELHRLLTTNLLHAGVPHLATHLLVIAGVGWMLERLLGWRHFAWIVGVSALGGSLITAIDVRDGYTIGASTLALGMIGCWAVLNARFPEQLTGALRASRPVALLGVLQFGLYELVAARSDLSAHLGGFLSGAAATAVAVRGDDLHRLTVPRWLPGALLVLGVLVLLALVRSVQEALLALGRS